MGSVADCGQVRSVDELKTAPHDAFVASLSEVVFFSRDFGLGDNSSGETRGNWPFGTDPWNVEEGTCVQDLDESKGSWG